MPNPSAPTRRDRELNRTHGETKDCRGCRFWSEMIAKAEGAAVMALCLAPEPAPLGGQYTSGRMKCDAWKSGHLGVVDDPPDYGEAVRAAYDAEEKRAQRLSDFHK